MATSPRSPSSSSPVSRLANKTSTPLPQEINTATRAIHTHLNRLITARLPLALPPHAHDPSLYWKGVKQFSRVYGAFEESWADILRSEGITSRAEEQAGCSDCCGCQRCGSKEEEDEKAKRPGVEARILEVLKDLHDPDLLRIRALQDDLWHLYNLHCDYKLSADVYNSEEMTSDDNPSPHLAATIKLVERIQFISQDKPHLLIAYFWIFYMALFSGGRWIRAQLQAAPPSFWVTPFNLLSTSSSASASAAMDNVEKYPPSPADSAYCPTDRGLGGFSFLSFATEPDGLPTKSRFLETLAKHEAAFTRAERDEIVEEGVWIFECCVAMVGALDEWLGRRSENTEGHAQKSGSQEARAQTSSRGKLSVNPAIYMPSPKNQMLIRRTSVSFLGLAALWWASTRYFA